MPHPLTREIDVETFQDEMSARLGRPVAVVCRAPGQPRLLFVLDPATGGEVEVSAADMESALSAHRPPAGPSDTFAAAVKAATTLDGLKAALLGTDGPGAEARRDRARHG